MASQRQRSTPLQVETHKNMSEVAVADRSKLAGEHSTVVELLERQVATLENQLEDREMHLVSAEAENQELASKLLELRKEMAAHADIVKTTKAEVQR